MSGTNWIYRVLGSHDKVDKFRFFLSQVMKYPDHYPPIVASIAQQFFNQDRISRKQLEVVVKVMGGQYK